MSHCVSYLPSSGAKRGVVGIRYLVAHREVVHLLNSRSVLHVVQYFSSQRTGFLISHDTPLLYSTLWKDALFYVESSSRP